MHLSGFSFNPDLPWHLCKNFNQMFVMLWVTFTMYHDIISYNVSGLIDPIKMQIHVILGKSTELDLTQKAFWQNKNVPRVCWM